MGALVTLFSFKEWRPTQAFSVMDFDDTHSYGGKGDGNPLIKQTNQNKAEFCKAWNGQLCRSHVTLLVSMRAWLFHTRLRCSCL